MTAQPAPERPREDVQTHSGVVRLTHWLNAVAMLIMIGSGWRIYNWEPILPFRFPVEITLGGEESLSEAVHNEDGLAGALQWHFAGMWLLVISFAVYLGYGFASGHFRRDFLPLGPRAVLADFVTALRLRLAHRLGHYNAVQKAAYVGVLSAMLLTILSGLSIWKPTQFQELTWLFGGFDNARIVHFLGMSAIVLFILVHLMLVILVPKTLVAMIVGKTSAAAPVRAQPSPPGA
ncbi:MAG: cytochrome b/b6 domain-containing protein [Alphaproteobacteria bacterium]